MILMDLYESGLGYRALRVETSGESDLDDFVRVFGVDGVGRSITTGAMTFSVVVSGRPPWRIMEASVGVVNWTLTASQCEDILLRIQKARSHPGEEVLLNEEHEDLVVELIHHR